MDKTLLISEIFPPVHGGSGRWFVELYSRLSRDHFLIAAGAAADSRSIDEALAQCLQIVRVPLSSVSWGFRSLSALGFYWRTYKTLERIVQAQEVTRVHCGRCLPEGVLGLMLNLRFGLPYICYVHGEDIQTAAESRELSWIIHRVLARCARLIANSHNTAGLLREQWQVPDSKISVLHPGMDASRFAPAEPDPVFLDSMDWNDRTVILTVGRLQRRKGQDMLIRALPLLLEQHPDILYAIVGNGDERQLLEQLVNDLKLQHHVVFLGDIDDATMIHCYQQCTLFALPNRTEGSDIEGFGMVLAEAQACGKAVLAGDSGGTRETMIVGETGVIADCTSPEPLAEALLQLLGNRDRLVTMGQRGRQHVSEHLDWPVHAALAQQIFKLL